MPHSRRLGLVGRLRPDAAGRHRIYRLPAHLIGELAFGAGSARNDHVKVGVLLGSLLAIVVLRIRSTVYQRICQAEERDTKADGTPDIHQHGDDTGPPVSSPTPPVDGSSGGSTWNAPDPARTTGENCARVNGGEQGLAPRWRRQWRRIQLGDPRG
jgi:hypothetical protein